MTKNIFGLSDAQVWLGKVITGVVLVAILGELVFIFSHLLPVWGWVLLAICIVAGLYWWMQRKEETMAAPKFKAVLRNEVTSLSNEVKELRDLLIFARGEDVAERLVCGWYDKEIFVCVSYQNKQVRFAQLRVGKKMFGIQIPEVFWQDVNLELGAVQTINPGEIVTEHGKYIECLDHVFKRAQHQYVKDEDSNLRLTTRINAQSYTVAMPYNRVLKRPHAKEFVHSLIDAIAITLGVIDQDAVQSRFKATYCGEHEAIVIASDGVRIDFAGEVVEPFDSLRPLTQQELETEQLVESIKETRRELVKERRAEKLAAAVELTLDKMLEKVDDVVAETAALAPAEATEGWTEIESVLIKADEVVAETAEVVKDEDAVAETAVVAPPITDEQVMEQLIREELEARIRKELEARIRAELQMNG